MACSREGVFKKAEPRVLGTMAPLLAVTEFGISSADDRSWEEPILFWSWCPESPPLPFFFLKEFFLNYVNVGAGSVHMSAGTQRNQRCRLPWEMTTVGARKQTPGPLQEQDVLLTAEPVSPALPFADLSLQRPPSSSPSLKDTSLPLLFLLGPFPAASEVPLYRKDTSRGRR